VRILETFMVKNDLEIDVHDAFHVQEATKVDLIVDQVASELQEKYPEKKPSQIKKIAREVIVKAIAWKTLEWVLENPSEIVELVEKILSGIDSLGP